MTLLYRATRDGFRATDFHTKCDNHGPTLSLFKSDLGKVFGGYTSTSWKTVDYPGDWERDDQAFLFSLTHKSKHMQ
jgi:hypothetical protein